MPACTFLRTLSPLMCAVTLTLTAPGAAFSQTLNQRLLVLESALPALQSTVTAQQAVIADHELRLKRQSVRISELLTELNAAKATIAVQATGLAAVTDKLVFVTRSGTDLFITGANVHVRNGTGHSFATGPNGLGNLVIGYNELRLNSANVRTGSHNLVVGTQANFSSTGGIVGGFTNSIAGLYPSVLGGNGNAATGNFSTVSGGANNTASGQFSSIGGGRDQVADQFYAHIP